MKRSQMKTLLLIEGAVCLTLTLALRLIEGAAFSFAAFPGSAAGQGLSMLAGTGRLGFALALTLYAFLVLLPLYALARIRARRDWKAEDTLLGLCSLAVAGALFPRGWVAYWSTSAETLFPRLAWQWLLFALLAGWVVLRLLRRFSDGGTQELLKLFRVLLGLAAAYFVFAVFFVEFAGLLTAIDTLKAGNTAFAADTLLPAAADGIEEPCVQLYCPCAALWREKPADAFRRGDGVLCHRIARYDGGRCVHAGERGLCAEARRMVREGAQAQCAACACGQPFAGGLRAADPQHEHFDSSSCSGAVLRARRASRCAAHRLERRPCGGQRPLYLRVMPWRSRYIWTRC